MPTAKDLKEEKNSHTHNWYVNNRDLSEELCSCGWIKISDLELDRRTEEWNNYHELVRSSEVYLDYLAMREAFKNRNKPKIQEIMKRIESRNNIVKNRFGEDTLELKDPLPKPSFPDPLSWNKYFVT